MLLDPDPLWATVAETMHDGLLIIDPGGVIVSVNQSGEELTGYSRDELIGQSCRILNCTGCKVIGKGVGPDYCGLFQIGRVRSKRCTITSRTGEEITVLKRASVLEDDDGRIMGAVETLTDLRELIRRDEELDALRQKLPLDGGFQGLIGQSPAMARLFGLVETVSASAAPVLIRGASGSGKELVARAIHDLGPRRDGPFIRVNCAALNESLLESELFGHVKGSFTGADRDRVGRFEAASGGDILLDEIGDIPPATQVKLLRVLEEGEIERVGDHQPIKVDVRIIAATHRNLEDMVRRGDFREDLYYRIDVVPIEVPPLYVRRDDVPLLAQHFLGSSAARNAKPVAGFSPAAMEVLTGHHWPGNVRELKHAVEYAVVLCPGETVEVEHLPPRIVTGRSVTGPAVDTGDGMCSELAEALARSGGNQSRAAELLGVSRVTVWNRLKRCGLDPKQFKP